MHAEYAYSLSSFSSGSPLFWLREHRQKTFVTHSGFWPSGVGGGLSEYVKKGKFLTKIFFSVNLNEVLKNCEK